MINYDNVNVNATVVGLVPPDETWQKMKAVWDACKNAEVTPPKEVEDFFDGEEPTDEGMEVEIYSRPFVTSDGDGGIELSVEDIPENVKTIHFKFWY